MGFENLFIGKEKDQPSKEATNTLDPKGKSRRAFLKGAGALAASAVLPHTEAFGQKTKTYEPFPITSFEDRERNVLAIRAHEQRLQRMREALADPNATQRDVLDIVVGPPTDRGVFEGTELDREAFFRSRGSWPSVQIRKEVQAGGDTQAVLRFAHQENREGNLQGYANGFFVNGMLISNRHVGEGASFYCESITSGEDIAGCSIEDGGIISQLHAEDYEKARLMRNRQHAGEDLHGRLVHIPSIHEHRGAHTPDNTDITSGIAFKITPNFLYGESKSAWPFFDKNISEQFREELLNSYACIIPPRGDTNKDGVIDLVDNQGLSGSPVFTDDACAANAMVPSGVLWATAWVHDYRLDVTHTLALFHGPDTLTSMIDRVNTVVSGALDESLVPNKRELTEDVQLKLKLQFGYHNLTVDGLYGEQTAQAVYDFQMQKFNQEAREALVIPGVVDRYTWDALFPEARNPDKQQLWYG